MSQAASRLAPVVVESAEEVTRAEATLAPAAPLKEGSAPAATDATPQPAPAVATTAAPSATLPRSSWSFDQWLQLVKEGVTSLIALLLIGYTLVIASRVLSFAGEAEKMADAKDVLLLLFGLVGVVIGYYFGRIPADARAAQAQQQVAAASQQLGQINAQVDTAAAQLDNALNKATTGGAAATRSGSAVTDETMLRDMQRARDELRSIANATRPR